ncbi:B3 domain-containing protein Os07g0563300 isoform X2 [Hevea brasiliensis]|uniref:B3 domain-containing protein Os07g0563300 isoform X2 n=1 Tax=Hevea brasiliensis TaxID=3981 RepID=UPI0025CDE774|nr:B3 domain-containing protein Os07g0563300 isoform X2 [Hevea brasiliensis]
MSTAPSSSSSSTSKKCFNSDCTDFKSRKGWRLRSGDFAELCDRCSSAYEEGRFCDTFHFNATGWRCCESCGKRVHCGCIVSIQAFTLLDAGGIECMACARKNVLLASNSACLPSLFYNAPFSERLKDLSVKNWSQLAGSGPVPWRQAPSLFNSSIPHTELHPRTLYEIDRHNTGERSSALSLEKGRIEDFSDRLINGNLKLGTQDMLENGNAGNSSEEKPGLCLGISQQPSLKEDPSTPQLGMAVPFASLNEPNGQIGGSGTPLRQPAPPLLAKQFHGNLHNGVSSSPDTQIRNGRPRADARGRSQLLPRYWPRFTDEELQQISGNSNSVITPLFEKMLSASDAGRIGRLVLPKKCAEAYFPPISHPEGLPLKVQDSKGKEWVFQFRFWPNNNSRMYVLEGVTPCIQNMRLQAGDTVTFSRLEPEGKLVMGFRKASTAPSSDQVELADPSPWSKVDKSGYIAKEVLEAKSSIRKRKNCTLGSKSKRLRIDNEDMIELKLTWEEAQGLLRPPPDHFPSVVVIEGFEFEEYEDAPILGKPTILATDNLGQKIQWVQCEDCFKWRKLPANALLHFKWTCSANSWDPERSLCSAAQELTAEQFEDLLPTCNLAASKKMKAAKQEADNVEALEGLDTLANLAILGENEALPTSSQATTKHPRHRPGCSCIVCIQPPSGKGPKHKQTCTCNVCQTVKRRFKTLMMKREKKQSEKEAETTRKKQQQTLPEKLLDDDPSPSTNTGSSSPNKKKVVSDGYDDDPNKIKSSTSPFKGQIDLNIQPEREEELSPGSDSGSMMKMIQDATERYLRQQRLSFDGDSISASNQTLAGHGMGEKVSNGIMLGSSHQDSDKDHPATFSMEVSASSPATG